MERPIFLLPNIYWLQNQGKNINLLTLTYLETLTFSIPSYYSLCKKLERAPSISFTVYYCNPQPLSIGLMVSSKSYKHECHGTYVNDRVLMMYQRRGIRSLITLKMYMLEDTQCRKIQQHEPTRIFIRIHAYKEKNKLKVVNN